MMPIDGTRRLAARVASRLLGIGAALAGCLSLAPAAWSFDTGPHFAITEDALRAEGFGKTALEIAQINNWFVDMYEKYEQNPFSGHASFGKELLALSFGDREHWPDDLVHAADATHFDSTNGGFESAAVLDAEWDRLRRSVYRLAIAARNANDPLQLLTVLGTSLHQVQDFYAHTNWVEPRREHAPGYDGPGWKADGWGDAPTWFDIPAATRNAKALYTAGSKGVTRGHGHWHSDENHNLATAMNKDWSGRPLYTEAYVAAYYGTRQWVQAVRSWVNNEAFWQRVLTYAGRFGRSLDHELKGAFEMSFYSGHWDGQGEPAGGSEPGPGGSLLSLRSAVKSYFEDRAKTLFRSKWEATIRDVADPGPVAPLGPVPSSQVMQRGHYFVRLQVPQMGQVDNFDIDYVVVQDRADFYARAEIAGQEFVSGQISGYDTYTFPRPNYPFTFLKAVPHSARFYEPLCNLRVEVTTSDDTWSGTDDTVSLRINDTTRFSLDKQLYNDFERGDRDIYSLPLDGKDLRVADIRYLQIEKSPDGAAGGWKLKGIRVWANNTLIYENGAINKWLEDDHRTWRAPTFRPTERLTGEVTARLALYDGDGFLYGDDDHADLHPDHDRRDLALIFDPSTGAYRGDLLGRTLGVVTGDDRYDGRLDDDGDRAWVMFRFDTIVPAVPIDWAWPLINKPALMQLR